MNNSNALVKSMLESIRFDRKKRKNLIIVLLVLSLAITGLVFYQLRITGLTLAGDADCGYTEHTHNDDCIKKTLICDIEDEEHIHDDNCYKTEYVCGYEYEHVHTAECYSDDNADKETEKQWEKSVSSAQLTDDLSYNLVSVAKTQLGYTESTKNFQLNDDKEKKGYTRYGDWYGTPYSDWNTLFIAFCLEYSGVPVESVPYSVGAYSWTVELGKAGLLETACVSSATVGSIVFFDTNNDDKADKAGIIASKIGKEISVIEGDSNNCVEQNLYYLTDSNIIGYASIGEMLPSTSLMSLDAPSAQANNENELEFGEYITGVTLQYRSSNSGAWTDADINDVSVTVGDNLRFNIHYTIPGNMLDSTTNTIVYQVPSQLKLVSADSGIVKDSSNNRMGTYSISSDGYITITFDDDAVALNQAGSPIVGYITFDCSVDDVQTDDSGNVVLDFNGTVVNIHVDEKQDTQGTIDVTKTDAVIDNVYGIAEYTIVVSSETGTATAPVVTDYMSNGMLYYDDLVVRDSNGNDVTSSCTITNDTQGSNQFVVTLPDAMDAGDSYTITYKGKMDSLVDGEASGRNRATAVSTDEDGNRVVDYQQINTRFSNNLVKKSGTLSDDGSTISWSIKVNTTNENIGGWKLSDKIDSETFNGTVTIKNETTNQTITTTLPYTFPENNTDEYTVTYTTEYKQNIGTSGVVNTASLIPPGETEGVESTAIIGTGENYNPLKKTANSLTIIDDSTVVINWTVKISASVSKIEADWSYKDTFASSQRLTSQQKNLLRQNIITELTQKGFVNNSDYTITISENGFEIDFTKDLELGEEIVFSYESTGLIDDPNLPQYFKNKGIVVSGNYDVESSDEIGYHPVVHKEDPKAEDEEITEHEYYDSDGCLYWNIVVSLPEGTTGPISIIETLPQGVTLEDLYFNVEGSSENGVFIWRGFDGVCDMNEGVFATATRTGQIVEICLDEDFINAYDGKRMTFRVKVSIDDLPEEGTIDRYTNSVTVKKNNEVLGTDTQTQKVTVNIYHDAIDKQANYDKDVDASSIPYSIVVNPEGYDLIEGSDTLKLVDKMQYYNHASSPTNATLKPNSVHVYERTDEGEKGRELTGQEISYIYEESSVGNYDYKTLTITLPDGVPLIVEYEYVLSGSDKTDVSITNTANIVGVSGSDGEAEIVLSVQIHTSAAGANVQGATIYKVDSENYGIGLAGAVFSLYRYDETLNDYILVDDQIVTDDTGIVALSDLIYNTAYKLVETKAPDNYNLNSTPYYFIIQNVTSATYTKPNDFNGEMLSNGDVIYRPNISQLSSIDVEKKWFDIVGNEVSHRGSVEFEVWRKIQATQSSSAQYNFAIDLRGRYNSEIFYQEKNSYPYGTVINFSIDYIPYDQSGTLDPTNPKTPTIKENGTAITPNSTTYVENTAGDSRHPYIITFTYQIVIGEDITITANLNPSSDYSWGGTTIESMPTVSNGDEYDDELVGTYTISSSNSWMYTVDELPVTGNIDGADVTYTYYVKEKNVSSNTEVSYENNDGVTNGTITIKNQVNETPYQLPKTGSPLLIGLMISSVATISIGILFAYLYKKKRERKLILSKLLDEI